MKQCPNIAVVTVAYNRLSSLKRLLASLVRANYMDNPVDLIISIDKSDSTQVGDFADTFIWQYGKKRVYKQPTNLGLKRHMMSLGKWLDAYDAIVVLEDDVVVSPAFYNYVLQTVTMYQTNKNIAGISLYSFPVNPFTHMPFEPLKNGYDVFLMQMAQSWGQVWLRDQWHDFYSWYLEHDMFEPAENVPAALFNWKNSWLRYHIRYCIDNNKYFIYPYHSFSSNCGELGVHAKATYNAYQTSMQNDIVGSLRLPDNISEMVQYDAFFENQTLYEALVLTPDDCAIDCYGYRGKAIVKANRRYILTPVSLPFKTTKSFGLKYHPIEMNIILNNEGNDILLYDTEHAAHMSKSSAFPSNIILYTHRIMDLIYIFRKMEFKYFYHIIKDKLISKIRWYS